MTASLMAVVLIVSGCGGSKTTASTNPQTTPSGTTTDSSISADTLSEKGISITAHSKDGMAFYKGQCLICHGQFGTQAQPYPPNWDAKASGSIHNLGVYSITPGSKADHTGYTNVTDCTQAGCHAAPKS